MLLVFFYFWAASILSCLPACLSAYRLEVVAFLLSDSFVCFFFVGAPCEYVATRGDFSFHEVKSLDCVGCFFFCAGVLRAIKRRTQQ